eukprot:scaffold80048_cov43-Cyclotella_meneghiniana.AAC.5
MPLDRQIRPIWRCVLTILYSSQQRNITIHQVETPAKFISTHNSKVRVWLWLWTMNSILYLAKPFDILL